VRSRVIKHIADVQMIMKSSQITVIICAALALPRFASAATTCEPAPQGALCTSQVDFMSFAETAFMSQQQSQWCWAASLSMLYAYYQHPVSQSRLVDEVYGGAQNIPASSYTIASKLNGCFVDDAGDSFQSILVAAYDAQAGINAISNQQIIAALDQGRPLIIGTRSHAMVLTAIQYYQTPQGPFVVAAGVFDPWPGVGARALETDELSPVESGGSLRLLALPRITDGAVQCTSTPTQPDDSVDDPPIGCASVTRPSSATLLFIALAALRFRRRRPRLQR
jgi:hypothetical protein